MNSIKKCPTPRGKSLFLVWMTDFIPLLFVVLLFSYLLLVLIETLFKGSVSCCIDLNILLGIVILLGTISVIWVPLVSHPTLNLKYKLLMVSASIGVGIIIWYKTVDLGWLSFIVSIGSGGMILLMSTLIWHENEDEDT